MLAGYAKVIALAAIAVSGGLIISIFVVPFLTSPIATSNTDSDTTDVRRIVTIAEPYADDLIFKNVKAADSGMQTNSMQRLMYGEKLASRTSW